MLALNIVALAFLLVAVLYQLFLIFLTTRLGAAFKQLFYLLVNRIHARFYPTQFCQAAIRRRVDRDEAFVRFGSAIFVLLYKPYYVEFLNLLHSIAKGAQSAEDGYISPHGVTLGEIQNGIAEAEEEVRKILLEESYSEMVMRLRKCPQNIDVCFNAMGEEFLDSLITHPYHIPTMGDDYA